MEDRGSPPAPARGEDEDITAAPFWTMCPLVWSTESPEELKSAVALLVQEVPPLPQGALPLARGQQVRGLEA
jgi:hypothetical protein